MAAPLTIRERLLADGWTYERLPFSRRYSKDGYEIDHGGATSKPWTVIWPKADPDLPADYTMVGTLTEAAELVYDDMKRSLP